MAEVAHVDNATLGVDLEAQEITMADGRKVRFDVDPFRKECLIDGVDEIGLTLKEVHKVEAFEARQRAEQPWLYG
jgi:3-isopropylmalate/(R)-2-methylmalate dehydratase small subunit